MFARRQRPAREEEEPLVPHGLIWQATETPATSQKPRPSPPSEGEKPITMPTQESGWTETAPASQASPRKLGAISPPLRWPSSGVEETQVEETPKQPDSAQATVAALIAQNEPAPNIEPPEVLPPAEASPQKDSEPVTPVRVRPLSKFSLAKNDLLRTSAHVREQARSSLENGARSLGQAKGRLVISCRSVVPRGRAFGLFWFERMKRLLAFSTRMAQVVGERSSQLRVAFNGRRAAWKPVIAERTKRLSQGFARAISNARSHRIQLRIRVVNPRSGWLLYARQAGESWRKKLLPAGADSRLWVSMTMAAASALLAAGFISVMRPYAPASAGTHSAAPKIKPANPPGDLPREQPPVKRPASSAPRTKGAKPSPTVPQQKTAKPATAQRRPRPRRSQDDDYVATDTYTYYGKGGKRTH